MKQTHLTQSSAVTASTEGNKKPASGSYVLRLPEVLDRLGVKKTTLYALIKKQQFPEPLKISSRASAWLVSDVDDYIASRRRGKL